ncbi:MAG: iron-containing alcohol dehydrogenase [Rhodospirillales bacterium]|nr:iron-containing alcohol dehydrogenase [Rhodospirillales bacterium]
MLPIAPFGIARLPRIVFGAGTVAGVPDEARAHGERALIVTGARSFRSSARWQTLLDGLSEQGIAWFDIAIEGEPTPEIVDHAIAEFSESGIDVVIGIGGGSALDAAKAIAGMLLHGYSVVEHLEGLGIERPYAGPAVPLIAVPTTAGTGSEATKNAVLSRHGADGFKKSFRDEELVARVAIVDPELLVSCPKEVLAANGMDAFTQLLESYVSIKANPMTEALAWSGLEAFHQGFFAAWEGSDLFESVAGRSRMAYASLISGVCLAQTGLGSVHGLASPLGAFFPIPHGVCCGTLVAEATDINITALLAREPDNPVLDKYARVGALLAPSSKGGRERRLHILVETLRAWTERLPLPLLDGYGMAGNDIARVVAASRGSSMKTNPIVLTDDEIGDILMRRLGRDREVS